MSSKGDMASTSNMECDEELSDEATSEEVRIYDRLAKSDAFTNVDIDADTHGQGDGAQQPTASRLDIAVSDSKRRCVRELFPSEKMKACKQDLSPIVHDSAIVDVDTSSKGLPKLLLSQISKTALRFAFEGKTINVYGTFNSSKDSVRKFLRSDLIDGSGFGSITLVVGSAFIEKFKSIISVDTFLRVEGAVVTTRSAYDGGSVDVSLVVDATTIILKAEPFECSISFIPETSIRAFLHKAERIAYLKGTLAFVILQIDTIERLEGGTYEHLTVADGPLATDRATLTFVTKQKQLYYRLVEEFRRGDIIPYVARNIGTWKGKTNTLSVLDITVVTPLTSERLKNKLIEAFNKQITDMGYGRQVYGSLEIVNFNGTLVKNRCSKCRSDYINALGSRGYCFLCDETVSIDQKIHLEGLIIQPAGEEIAVKLFGDIVDKILGGSATTCSYITPTSKNFGKCYPKSQLPGRSSSTIKAKL